MCISGYHVYKETWIVAIGEVLTCARVPTNSDDRYAVAVEKDGTIADHLPKKVPRMCTLSLRRGSCNFLYCPRFSPMPLVVVASSTSLFARAIASLFIEHDKSPLGLGSPSCG